ncbi:LuxR C-terminal-related transcriptional regulator [Actinomadura macrotermitis]|uniref:HTH luxR-type domain-containing protein n=1 Tax=Actinomadura macrotermitis TaxID=2585200 RepID=A0A7K0BPL7_9ACTN|nr:hypothetical protein [Actinomadura macrotermitis]
MSTPLRGRAAELAAVRHLIEAGRGALTFAGPCGIGKSALLEAAAGLAAEAGARVLWLRGHSAEAAVPYAGLHALLQPPASARPVLERLESGDVGPALALPGAVLAALSADAPVVCCVDDAHLVDPASLDVLGFVVRRSGAVLVAASAEAGDTPLGPLDGAAVAEIVGDLLPGPVPSMLRDGIVRAARGNPLAVVELVGALTPAQLAGTDPPPEHPPRQGRLWRGLAAALDGLSEPVLDALLLAAAEPGLMAGALPPEGLEAAEAAGFLVVEDGRAGFRQPLLGPVVYERAPLARRRRAHRLLAGVFDDAGDVLRRAWHRAAAQDAPGPELAEELAQAAEAARPYVHPAELVRVLARAAELTGDHRVRAARLVAAARAAWSAGQPHRARVLLAGFCPPAADAGVQAGVGLVRGNLALRAGPAALARDELLAAARLMERDRAQAVRTLMRAGEAGYLAGDHRRYLAAARDAAALRRADDPASLQLMFEYLDGMAATFRGRHREAAGPLRRVLELAPAAGGPSVLVWASVAGQFLGEDARALRLARRALGMARDRGAAAAVPQIIEFLVHAHYWLGRYDEAAESAAEGLRLAEEAGQPNTAALHLSSLAMVSAIRGDAESARARSRAALRLAAAHGVGMVQARGAWALACLDLAAGRHAQAVAGLRATAWTGRGQGHLVVQVLATPQLVEAAARAGTAEAAGAREALAVYERWADSTGSPGRRALAARCRALLASPAESAELYLHALDLHQQAECDFERARTQLLFGGTLRRLRRRRDSREHLQQALETFDRLGARTWAQQARAELRAAGGSVGTGPADAARELTPQQLQIARLVAAGATNREIAARLYLSHRTVEHHLSKIFARLEVRSRVELARLF